MITAARIILVLSYTLRATLLLAIISAIMNQNWTVLFVSSLTLVLTFLPAIIKRNIKISLPAEFEIAIVVFIYTALFLGEVHDYYTLFWWWDVILHAGSGLALGFIGFLILFILYDEKKLQAKPITIALFSFCFALAMGALWEIFEFFMDMGLGLNMQKSGIADTMWDLIVDAIGALITSFIGYLYLRKTGFRVFEKLLKRFEKANPQFFTKVNKIE